MTDAAQLANLYLTNLTGWLHCLDLDLCMYQCSAPEYNVPALCVPEHPRV